MSQPAAAPPLGQSGELTSPVTLFTDTGHMILHLPHASTAIPPDVRAQFILGDEALAAEVLTMTDHFTDELFQLPTGAGVTVAFPVSRLVVDPERFEDDEREPMAARGMGVVYMRTSAGAPLRHALTGRAREQLIERWYRPHHAALTTAVLSELNERGRCLIVDAHSFPAATLPHELDQRPDRPDICFGTDEFHTPPDLVARLVAAAQELGWSVAVNRPFAGALVPMAYYQQDARVRSVMIEINRGRYMDERLGTKSVGFEQTRAKLDTLLKLLVAASAEP